MISEFSASYPIMGAARACGVRAELAYGYVWAARIYYAGRGGDDDGQNWARLVAAWRAIGHAHGEASVVAFQERIEAAIVDMRVYWPIPEWWSAVDVIPARRLPVIHEDSTGEFINQPPPID